MYGIGYTHVHNKGNSVELPIRIKLTGVIKYLTYSFFFRTKVVHSPVPDKENRERSTDSLHIHSTYINVNYESSVPTNWY